MATLSSHTLNGVDGTHAGGVGVEFSRLSEAGREVIFASETSPGGRLSEDIDASQIDVHATYELVFLTGDYWERCNIAKSDGHRIEEVVFRFKMKDPEGSYHMPVILSPNGYSTWRSS